MMINKALPKYVDGGACKRQIHIQNEFQWGQIAPSMMEGNQCHQPPSDSQLAHGAHCWLLLLGGWALSSAARLAWVSLYLVVKLIGDFIRPIQEGYSLIHRTSLILLIADKWYILLHSSVFCISYNVVAGFRGAIRLRYNSFGNTKGVSSIRKHIFEMLTIGAQRLDSFIYWGW